MPEYARPSDEPPGSLCLLRTSALGDVTHVVPLVRTLQGALPSTRLTWIIGKLEHRLVGDIDGVEFIVFDKGKGFGAFREVRKRLSGRRFDVLLHLQVALRANLLSALVHAPLRIGYDAARSKDLHGLFVNRRIAGAQRRTRAGRDGELHRTARAEADQRRLEPADWRRSARIRRAAPARRSADPAGQSVFEPHHPQLEARALRRSDRSRRRARLARGAVRRTERLRAPVRRCDPRPLQASRHST